MKEFFIRGGPMMWPLLVCSFVAVAIAVERAIFWLRERNRDDPDTVEAMLRSVEAADFESALATDDRPVSAAVRMMRAGMAHRDHGLRESMEVAGSMEIERMKRGMAVLDSIVTMAPLLGILGTVTGIIQCFDLLGSCTMQDARQAIGGIAQALITTAAGLAIALLALVPFNYYSARVDKEAKNLEHIGTQFQIAYRKGLARASEKRV